MLRDSVLYEIKDQWKNDALVPTIDKCIIFFFNEKNMLFFRISFMEPWLAWLLNDSYYIYRVVGNWRYKRKRGDSTRKKKSKI